MDGNMEELLAKAEELKFRIRELVGQNLLLSEENKKVSEQVEELKAQCKALEASNRELGQQLQLKKIATTINTDKNTTIETRERIDHLVREIDKCMAFLGKQ